MARLVNGPFWRAPDSSGSMGVCELPSFKCRPERSTNLLHVNVDLERLCDAAPRARHSDGVIPWGCAGIGAATSATAAAASSSTARYEGRSQQRSGE
jgi:hypothetical protein